MNILDFYQPSVAEKYLSDYLIAQNVLLPSDLEIESLLIKLNLFIVKGDFSMSLADYGGIVLAQQLSREQFIEKIASRASTHYYTLWQSTINEFKSY